VFQVPGREYDDCLVETSRWNNSKRQAAVALLKKYVPGFSTCKGNKAIRIVWSGGSCTGLLNFIRTWVVREKESMLESSDDDTTSEPGADAEDAAEEDAAEEDAAEEDRAEEDRAEEDRAEEDRAEEDRAEEDRAEEDGAALVASRAALQHQLDANERLAADNERLAADNERLAADNERLAADNERLRTDFRELGAENGTCKVDNQVRPASCACRSTYVSTARY
jgi:actin-related protein